MANPSNSPDKSLVWNLAFSSNPVIVMRGSCSGLNSFFPVELVAPVTFFSAFRIDRETPLWLRFSPRPDRVTRR